MTIEILDELRKQNIITEEPFIMTCGDGLTEETLFGGIDIKEFKETGKLKYLFNNSFLEHETVIFEEIFDAPPQVLLVLKDIMTSGWARKGNQKHKCKTKNFIALTNRSKEDFAEDDSLEALTQRFPLTLKVEWESYENKDWRLLFETVLGKEFFIDNKFKLNQLSEILTENNRAKSTFVSPRTAIHAATLYCNGGSLDYISDIDPVVLKEYYKHNKDNEKMVEDANMFEIISEYLKSNNLLTMDSNEAILDLILTDHKKTTGEDIEIERDEQKNINNINKLEYVLALVNIHNWSKSNFDKALNKKAELKELISEYKKLIK